MTRPRVGSSAEPVYFHAVDGAYRGSLPAYYDASAIEAAELLRSRYESIREEVMTLVATQRDAFVTNFTPRGYRDDRWQTLNLCTDRLRYHRNRDLVPATVAACESLPGLVTAQIAILGPGCELPAHHGDSNLAYRLHLGIDIPGDLPDLGISVGGVQAAWQQGDVIAFEDAHLHTVWNHTERPRTVLLVDVMKEEVRHRARWLAAETGAGVIVQMAYRRVPAIRRLPRSVLKAVMVAGAVPVWAGLPVQRRLAFAARSR